VDRGGEGRTQRMTKYRFDNGKEWEGPPDCHEFGLGATVAACRFYPSAIEFMSREEADRRNLELEKSGSSKRWIQRLSDTSVVAIDGFS
jgi:hypothetical protein